MIAGGCSNGYFCIRGGGGRGGCGSMRKENGVGGGLWMRGGWGNTR